jgi:osmoprotectant transport system substrate-binding protein
MIAKISKRATALGTAAAMVGTFLAGCSSSSSSPLSQPGSSGTIVVGSDNFSESVLLADIYGQALAAKGYNVSYKLNLASREVTYGLLKSGTISLKPEYNGALLAYLDSLTKKTSPQTSTDQVDSAVSAALASNLEILKPATAQDNDTLTLTKAEAAKLNLKQGATISDFAAALNSQPVTIGAAAEFATRTQGILGLEQSYGLKASQITLKSLDAGGTLTETALTTNAVDAGDLFTTDPTITQGGLLPLVDNKNIFGLQNVLPLVNKSALTSIGVDQLNAVDAKLDSATLLALDVKVQVDKQDPQTVATAWLKSQGLS